MRELRFADDERPTRSGYPAWLSENDKCLRIRKIWLCLTITIPKGIRCNPISLIGFFVKRIFIKTWSSLLLMQPLATALALADHGATDVPEIPLSVEFRTLDTNGAPLYAQQLEWWAADDAHNKKILHCNQNSCAAWRTKLTGSHPGPLHFVALKSSHGDRSCAVWYTGKIKLDDGSLETNHVSVRLERGPTACK